MNSQKQDASGGIAIQSAGDTNFNQGLSADDMGKIMVAIADQLPAYAAIAETVVKARLDDFKAQVLDRFDRDPATRNEAFQDPDFQFSVRNAQQDFARSGDRDVGNILVDLVAERSKAINRTRLALALNQSVEVSGTLTVEEYATLAFSYLQRMTKSHSVISIDTFIQITNENIDPYIDMISDERGSFDYLVAQRCAAISMGSISLYEIIKQTYPGIIMSGVKLEEIEPEYRWLGEEPNIICKCLNDPTMIQCNAVDNLIFDKVIDTWNSKESRQIPKEVSDKIWDICYNTVLSQDQLIEKYESRIPNFKRAFALWDDTPLKNLELTSIGIAIGHAHASSHGFSADLGIWIK